MKRTFDIDKAMEVSNVGEYEHNDLRLKVCDQIISISYTKETMKAKAPHFRVRIGDSYAGMFVDLLDDNAVALPHEPGIVNSIIVGLAADTPAVEEQKSDHVCDACEGSGIIFDDINLSAFACTVCMKFKSHMEARAFVKKVFKTVIRNGGGE